MAAPIAAPAPVAVLQPQVRTEAHAHLEHRRITDLSKHYLEKQKDLEAPWKAVFMGLAVITAVATAILVNVAVVPAILIGFATLSVSSSFATWLTNRVVDTRNRQAGEAVLSPGFYEWAINDPAQLATADAIVAAHARFAAPRATT